MFLHTSIPDIRVFKMHYLCIIDDQFGNSLFKSVIFDLCTQKILFASLLPRNMQQEILKSIFHFSRTIEIHRNFDYFCIRALAKNSTAGRK